MLHIRERGKDLRRGAPVEGAHGKVVVSAFPDSELLFEIIKGIKTVRSIEFFIVFSMRSLNFTVVARGTNANQLVPDAKLTERLFKERFSVGAARILAVGEFKTVVRLHAFNSIGEPLYTMPDKHSRRIGAVLFKRFQIPKTAVFVDEGILIPLCACFLPDDADTRDEFDVDLYALTGILHLFVGLRDIFGVWQRCGHLTALAQKTVEP